MPRAPPRKPVPENVAASQFADTITVDSGSNLLSALEGDDTLAATRS